MDHFDLSRTPLLAEGIVGRAVRAGAKVIRNIRRFRTPEFVRHCVTNIAQNPDKVSQIKQKGTVHGICRATYSKNKNRLKSKHPKGAHHTTDAYHRAADRLGEGFRG